MARTADSPGAETTSVAWHVLQLKSNALDLACMNLARQGYETLMPRQQITRRTKRGLRRMQRALFPGYVFFSAPGGAINWTSVRSTRGVSKVVMSGAQRPAQLPPEAVTELQRATDGDGWLHPLDGLEAGDQVAVTNGPFTGWLAEVVAADDHQRIRLLVDMMGRYVPVEVTGGDVERAG